MNIRQMIEYLKSLLGIENSYKRSAPKLPDLSRQNYGEPEIVGTYTALFSEDAFDLLQYVRRNFYGVTWLDNKVRNVDSLELSVITDLINEGYGFRSMSRDNSEYNAYKAEAYELLDAKASTVYAPAKSFDPVTKEIVETPDTLHYPHSSNYENWPGRPGLRLIWAMLKEGN